MTETLTLVYVLETYETLPSDKHDKKSKFRIYLHDNLIGTVSSPIHDGARLLIKMGYSPHTLLTTRSQDSQHDSWVPKPLSHWAKWTTEEQDDRAVRLKSFREWERVGMKPASKGFYGSTYLNDMEGEKTTDPGKLQND